MKVLQSLDFVLDFFILRKNLPYVLGFAITDVCNLSCRHCRIANVNRRHMSYPEVQMTLRRFYDRGTRFVYFEGGEPYLWRDGPWRLADLVQLAKKIGFFRVHVFTNGTLPLNADPHFTWISIDGLPKTNHAIRGVPIEKIFANMGKVNSRRTAIVCTINSVNHQEIREFLIFIQSLFPGLKVVFFLHTPYYGFDSLLLTEAQRRRAIETIIECRRQGLPVLNSEPGLRAIMTGEYEHPSSLFWVADQHGEYKCCRAVGHPEVCHNCGYSAAAEILLARTFHPGAVRAMIGVF